MVKVACIVELHQRYDFFPPLIFISIRFIPQRKRTCFDLIRVLSFCFFVPCSVLQFQALSSVGWTWNHWARWPTQSFPTPRPPRDPQSFQLTRCRCQSRLCRSCTGRIPKRSERAATTWSDSNECTVQSLEGDGKTRNLPWRLSRVTCLIALLSWKGPIEKPTKDFRFCRFFR